MMRINNNYDNRTAELYNGKSKEETGRKKENESSKNIYGGNWMHGNNIAEKQAIAGKDALKRIMDVFSGERSVDHELERYQDHIDKQHEDIKDNMDKIRNLEEQEKEILKDYGVKDKDELSPGARKEYNEQVAGINQQKAVFSQRITKAQNTILEDTGVFKAVSKGRLKKHEMVDAQKEAEEIMKDANREAVNMIVDDAVEQQDKYLEEIKERAEEQQEQQKQQETPSGGNSRSMQQDIISAEAEKLVAEKRITREDIKGIACDEIV